MQPPDLLTTFLAPLENQRVSYFVTGSIASIFYGEPRLTHDVDLVINLDVKSIAAFIALFPAKDFYCPP